LVSVYPFGTVYICVVVAAALAFLLGSAIDFLWNGSDLIVNLQGLLDTMYTVMTMIGITCSDGILIGVFAPRMMIGVLLVL